MKWTSNKPKTLGIYWCLPAGAKEPTPVRVTAKLIIISGNAYTPADPIFTGCTFAGPITWPAIPKPLAKKGGKAK